MGVLAEVENAECVECGALFLGALLYKGRRYVNARRPASYCSAACKNRAQRARQRKQLRSMRLELGRLRAAAE